jgi:hypothetical protein
MASWPQRHHHTHSHRHRECIRVQVHLNGDPGITDNFRLSTNAEWGLFFDRVKTALCPELTPDYSDCIRDARGALVFETQVINDGEILYFCPRGEKLRWASAATPQPQPIHHHHHHHHQQNIRQSGPVIPSGAEEDDIDEEGDGLSPSLNRSAPPPQQGNWQTQSCTPPPIYEQIGTNMAPPGFSIMAAPSYPGQGPMGMPYSEGVGPNMATPPPIPYGEAGVLPYSDASGSLGASSDGILSFPGPDGSQPEVITTSEVVSVETINFPTPEQAEVDALTMAEAKAFSENVVQEIEGQKKEEEEKKEEKKEEEADKAKSPEKESVVEAKTTTAATTESAKEHQPVGAAEKSA